MPKAKQLEPCVVRFLPYQPPFDWQAILSFFRGHQLPHLELVDTLGYERVVKTSLGMGWFTVGQDGQGNSLRLSLWNGSNEDADLMVSNVRRMFDLDIDPGIVGKAMQNDASLAAIWTRFPGLRVARAWNGFESMLTTILGQLVSVNFGRTLTNELMRAAGMKSRHPRTGEAIHLFPTARRLLTADLSSIRTSEARRIAIRELAALVADGTLHWKHPLPARDVRKILLAAPGVGAWTSEYIAMRGFDDDDAFPGTDYVLKQELKQQPALALNRVRPWRAYAAIALWKNFAERKGVPHEPILGDWTP